MLSLLLGIGLVSSFPSVCLTQTPDLSGNWIRSGSVVFGEWEFTATGARRFADYNFEVDDPAYGCIGASWTRIWLNPNVLVQITQSDEHVRLRYEWMDIDRVVPLVDPTSADIRRSNIEGMPALGYSMAWYDGDTLVIDSTDFAPGYVSTMQEWAGMPQSRRMHAVERLTRSGDVLTIETIHFDPANYREPLAVTIDYSSTDFELMEYGCVPDEARLVVPE